MTAQSICTKLKHSMLTLEVCRELQQTFVPESTPSLVLLPDHTSGAQSGGDLLLKT